MTTLNWTAIIVAVIALIGSIIQGIIMVKAKKIEKRNSRNSKNSSNPGSFLCYAHGERLLKIEIENERLCREMKEIKSELRLIKEALK